MSEYAKHMVSVTLINKEGRAVRTDYQYHFRAEPQKGQPILYEGKVYEIDTVVHDLGEYYHDCYLKVIAIYKSPKVVVPYRVNTTLHNGRVLKPHTSDTEKRGWDPPDWLEVKLRS